MGRQIEDLIVAKDMSLDAILSKQTQASRMAASVMENGGMNYASAVQWCLSSISSVASLNEKTFGQEFHEAVTARLEDDIRLQTTRMLD